MTCRKALEKAAVLCKADAGRLKAKVGAVLPLADIGQVLALVQAGCTRGKVVLQIA